MKDVAITKLLQLSAAERIQLVYDLWDSIANVPEAVALTKEQAKELDKRFAAFRDSPDEGRLWNEVKTRILSAG